MTQESLTEITQDNGFELHAPCILHYMYQLRAEALTKCPYISYCALSKNMGIYYNEYGIVCCVNMLRYMLSQSQHCSPNSYSGQVAVIYLLVDECEQKRKIF